MDAMVTSILNAFFVLKFRLSVEVKAAEPAAVTVTFEAGDPALIALHSSCMQH